MQEQSKDNSGEKIFVRKKDFPKSTKKEAGVSIVEVPSDCYEAAPEALEEYLLDTHGHLIVKHDLFNHDGLTKDGIAEAFAEFGKKEKLSFFL
jgi:type I restriction enzyme M protein